MANRMFPISRLIYVALCFSIAHTEIVPWSGGDLLGFIQRRDAACGNTSYVGCSDPNLPAEFCCPAKTTCISLDNASTALCCPHGNSCTDIESISCDVSQQNVTAHPETSIMTTKLNSTLTSCGKSTCCPFGYYCEKAICVLTTSSSSASNTTTTASPTSSSTSRSSKTTSSATPAGVASHTSAASGIDSTQSTTTHCDRFPATAILAGFFPGMFAGALLCVIGVCFLGRPPTRPTSSSTDQSLQKPSHFRGRSADGTIIGVSEPIPQNQAVRTDFLRRVQPSITGNQSRLQRTGSRVRSWFSTRNASISSPSSYDMSTYPYSPKHYTVATPTVPTAMPSTPSRSNRPGIPREPSTESIKIYSPAGMLKRNNQDQAGNNTPGVPHLPPLPPVSELAASGDVQKSRPTTTFTDIMQRSGFEASPPKYNGR